ncbi:MAG: 1-acyl-sn-glycerol-3-phosphate acyltransferase [Bacteroidetes bacterium]|nr:1-acyl-sn-glycerol-3-phosphate acyltransferase [Bacteroidota bacterium]
MRALFRPLWWIYCIYALLLFIVGMLCVLPLIVVFSLQEPKKGGDRMYRVCRWWDNLWLTGIGIRHINIFESKPDESRQYVFVSNHISYLDIPMILQAVRRNGFRILGKAEMARVPIFGYIYSRAVVMVDRSSAQQRSRSVRELKSVLAMDTSVFIFPEGTFNETHRPLKEFYDGAFRIAIETQTPIQPILFLDTYDRMHYSSVWKLRPGTMRAVFLGVVEVEGLTIADLSALKAKVYRIMEESLIRYNASWIFT